FNFLGGVASGIAPEDIDWYLSEWRPKFEELEKANKTFCSKIKKATGAEPQYVVCPANRKILLAAVTGAK
ncbi:MAG: hypothetical protein LBG89_00495, partial [Rickettsiales bacterium]|nr:hypothetical protein [Rickettsiales bacterium]